MRYRSSVAAAALGWLSVFTTAAARAEYAPEEARAFLDQYCLACHQGESASAKFRVDTLGSPETFRTHPDDWTRLRTRVANAEMPPQGVPSPDIDAREAFLGWVETTFRSQACAADIAPVPSQMRRLNREEYSATVRDLLDLQLDVGASLPADGPGGMGFDNAGETLFLSPLHSEKYLDIAKYALEAAAKEFKSRERIFVARPGPEMSEEEAARRILEAFLPRAFRRPVDGATVESYLAQFEAARDRDRNFEQSVFFALRGALVSPRFLFHVEPDGTAETEQYALASRLSYFLWGSMPDELLFDLAAAGRMDDPHVLGKLVPRMLRDPRSLTFAERFVDQWLRLRELDGDKAPDAELFPIFYEDADLRSDIRLQPVLFFQELLKENLPLTDLLDSDHTILSRQLVKYFGMKKGTQDRGDPRWTPIPETHADRGGLLGMPAVLAVASYPYRTSPVLRGTWILDSILGAPAPPPPPDVPELEEPKAGEPPKSVREMLTQHRGNPVCASCHNRIDPLGFALENYDPLGGWREADAGKPIDASGQLPDGSEFSGPRELKLALADRSEPFVRNLTRRMLGYALGRGLAPADACTVETIVERVAEDDFATWTLIREIVRSDPFRQPPAGLLTESSTEVAE